MIFSTANRGQPSSKGLCTLRQRQVPRMEPRLEAETFGEYFGLMGIIWNYIDLLIYLINQLVRSWNFRMSHGFWQS